MIVELHMLQNFVPSCLNRDDTNSPKDCEFGGYRRARISSQCQKRAIRTFFDKNQFQILRPENFSHRTKRLADHVADMLAGEGRDRTASHDAVTAVLKSVFPKTAEKNGVVKTPYLVFLGRNEIEELKEVVVDHWDNLVGKSVSENKISDVKKALVNKLDGGKAADLALFGRMLADLPDRSREAACQVAHAISTNKVSMEIDYYTAVDDLKPDDTEGADMIGTVEFNSSCFYRYANIDLHQLIENLGDDEELARKTVTAFMKAMIEAIPTGKQNTFAAHNPPDFIMGVVRRSGQWNLANAFVQPARATGQGDLVANSVKALGEYWGRISRIFGVDTIQTNPYVWRDDADLPGLTDSRVASVSELIAAVDSKLPFADASEAK